MEFDIEQRKNKIIELINLNGRVKVAQLSRMFGISEVTIRIDLADLEKKGLLTRVHGGAVSTYKTYYSMGFTQRSQTNEQQKKAIALKLCEYIKDNDTIMMNSGTSTMYAFRAISAFKNLSIVTNSVAIALEAYSHKNITAVLLGGSINGEYQFTYGADAENQLSQYHADKCILSVDGVSISSGLTTYYTEEAELCRKMIDSCGSTIILADYSKIGRKAFTKISGIKKADHLITNMATSDELVALRKKGVIVSLA